ncbi:MAG TPA: VacJ family lipoprotein [Casimicrobiaceae bacterium]|nr:VacJ family lipoprotein [Casimicrobiaceae bacterium]
MKVHPIARVASALAFAALLGGCATTQGPGATQARSSPDDPFEPFNRAMYQVHEVVDGHLVKPIAQGYVAVIPSPVRQVVGNILGNIDDFFSGINGVLQNKPEEAGTSFGRVIINTFIGIGGMIDVASSGNIEKYSLDFGQTLGVWGLPAGPYLFVPVFGPTDVRDGLGTIARGYADPIGYISDVPWRNSLYGLAFVERRAAVLDTESLVSQAAIDPYTFIRRAYLQRREFMVTGKRPVDKEDQ